MPTAYTEKVLDGTMTDLRSYVMHCASGMGQLMSLRDEPFGHPLPLRLFPSDLPRLDNAMAELTAEIAILEGLSVAEADAASKRDFARLQGEWNRRRDNRIVMGERCEAMLRKVEDWPHPEALEPLRLFMKDQLLLVMEHDCANVYDLPPSMKMGEAWRKARLDDKRKSLKFFATRRAEEVARTDAANLWLDTLHTSLMDMPI